MEHDISQDEFPISSEDRTQVVVVGAGLSGLVAARVLVDSGVDVVVLEAAPRVGGRAMSETSSLGSRLDLGGQWIGAGHHRVAALADELGATVYPMHSPRLLSIYDGDRRLRPYSPAVAANLVLLGMAQLVSTLRMCRGLVGVPLSRWIARIPTARARRLVELVATTSWTADLDALSIAGASSMIRVQGGLLTMLSTAGGAQDSLIVEGAGTLPERLAQRLGERVRVASPVHKIRATGEGVVVSTPAGAVAAERVIVAMPAPMAARIEFDPPLHGDHLAAQRHQAMGSVYKAIAVYERPFWRDDRDAEMLVLDGPGFAVFDTSAPGGPGHLCFLIGGDDALRMAERSKEDRRSEILERVARHVGAVSLKPVGWHDKAWQLDEFVLGGYLALPTVGSDAGHLPSPNRACGVVHWAGSESSTEHPGYLEGAIAAGERAATEVLAQLSGRSVR